MFNKTETADDVIPIIVGSPLHQKDIPQIIPVEMDLYKNITSDVDDEGMGP